MKTLFTIFASLTFLAGNSQTLRQDQRVWMSYIGQYKASPKWGYHMEASFRMDNELEQNQQNLFRVGVIFHSSDTKNITLGYALVNTFSKSASDYFTENRLWEQFQVTTKWSKDVLMNRFRLEQRWVEQFQISNSEIVDTKTAYQNRFRILNRFLGHITQLQSGKEELYFVAQNELFVNIGENNVNAKIIDQNRLFTGFGLNYNNTIRLELGYMNHFITSSTSSNVMNHTIAISLFHNIVL